MHRRLFIAKNAPFFGAGFGLLISFLLAMGLLLFAIQDGKKVSPFILLTLMGAGATVGGGVGLGLRLMQDVDPPNKLYQATVNALKDQVIEDAATGALYEVEVNRSELGYPAANRQERYEDDALPPNLQQMINVLAAARPLSLPSQPSQELNHHEVEHHEEYTPPTPVRDHQRSQRGSHPGAPAAPAAVSEGYYYPEQSRLPDPEDDQEMDAYPKSSVYSPPQNHYASNGYHANPIGDAWDDALDGSDGSGN